MAFFLLNPAKTKALADKDILKNEKELRAFLGSANYYRKHIPNYSNIAAILYSAINKFVWTDAHTSAFNQLKSEIIKATTLAPPNPKVDYVIFTDASIQGIGAALIQETRPVAFASRTLKPAETKYAPVQLEALGLVYALKQFAPYIYGKRTTVYTDQISLLSLMTNKEISNILDRYKTYIMGFDLDIKYVKGKDNHIADCLSRKVFTISLTNTYNALDAFLTITNYLQLPYILDNFHKHMTDKEKLDYPDGKMLSRGKTRYYCPLALRFMLLTRWHEHPLLGNHNGYEKGSLKFKNIFHWPLIDHDIRKVWVTCQKCLQNKSHGPLSVPVQHKKISNATTPWHTLNIDYFTLDERTYILVVIDEFSKFVNLIQYKNMGVLTTILALKRLFYRLGFPKVIRSDNSPAFKADDFTSFCNTFSIEHMKTSPHNHQGNAIVERFNRTLRSSIRLYKDIPVSDLIMITQYAHNFSYSTSQEGRPKDYILSTPDVFTDEEYSNSMISGHTDLLAFIKNSLKSDTPIENKTFTPLPIDTVVYKHNISGHKNDIQFFGPYKIIEHLYGDTYLISRMLKTGRTYGTPEKTNARQLKLAPAIMQTDKTILPKLLGNQLLVIDEPQPSSNLDKIQDNNVQQRRGRGRPRKQPR
uniref:RNA-directed DNA polymerase n=1 Tax=Parastrongyloides trichosuri TaxID=131310 RepID=A0A0N4ZXX9_PARTI